MPRYRTLGGVDLSKCHIMVQPSKILSTLGSSSHDFAFPHRPSQHTYITRQFTSPWQCGMNTHSGSLSRLKTPTTWHIQWRAHNTESPATTQSTSACNFHEITFNFLMASKEICQKLPKTSCNKTPLVKWFKEACQAMRSSSHEFEPCPLLQLKASNHLVL